MTTTAPIALVTGASGGLGKEMARQLAELDWTVLVGARNPERGRAAADEIGRGARWLGLDVTDAASIAAAAAQVDELDVLINNAGVSPTEAPAADTSAEELRATLETNVVGVLAVTNAFLPALRRSRRPRIVNVSSGTGSLQRAAETNPRFGPNGILGSHAAYRASKTALNALTLFYAQALEADGIKVNALAPGLRRTNLNTTANSSEGDPAEGAAGAVRLALLPDDGPTGGFFSWDGSPVPW